jgi:hypothetical protein
MSSRLPARRADGPHDVTFISSDYAQHIPSFRGAMAKYTLHLSDKCLDFCTNGGEEQAVCQPDSKLEFLLFSWRSAFGRCRFASGRNHARETSLGGGMPGTLISLNGTPYCNGIRFINKKDEDRSG